MSNELVALKDLKAVEVFKEGGVKPLIDLVREELSSEVPDVSTDKGRKRIASRAHLASKSKTALDKMGKDLADQLNAKLKPINAERKIARDELDKIRDETRQPLTDWENEQAEIEAAKQAEIEAAELAKQKDIDHEMALLLDDKFNQEAKAELVRIEQERIAYEAQLAANAAAEATRTAETKALEETQRIEAEKAEAIRKEQRAILEKEQSEQREKQAIIDLENAEKEKVIQAEQAEARRISDIETAKQQQIAAQKEEEARLAVEQQARDEDVENQRVVNQSAVAALLLAGIDSGLTEDQAKIVVKAIIKGQIPNVKLTY